MPEIYLHSHVKTTLGESPIWDVEEERLYWIDVRQGTIFRSTINGCEIRSWPLGDAVTSVALRERAGVIVTAPASISLLDLDTGDTEVVFESAIRLNDAKVDRQGRLVTGTVDTRLVDPATQWLSDVIKPAACLFE